MDKRSPPLPRSYWVSPHLLAGAYPGATDRQEALEKVAVLIGAGVKQFLDLTDDRDGLLPYEDLLADLAPGGGVVRQAVPVRDLTARCARRCPPGPWPDRCRSGPRRSDLRALLGRYRADRIDSRMLVGQNTRRRGSARAPD